MSEIASNNGPPRVRARARITQSERKRATILDAALEFLWTHPSRDLRVDGLVSAVPGGRSAFYEYFNDLQALMRTLLGDLEPAILSVANPWLAGGDDRRESLRTARADFVRVCHARGPILRATVEGSVGDERMEHSWNALLERFDVAAAERIEADQEAGLIRPLDARVVLDDATQKTLSIPSRRRRVPCRFSWIDQRLVRERHIARCTSKGLALHLFLVTVVDADGLSFYGDDSIATLLGRSEAQAQQARLGLMRAGLIAFRAPLYQVLSVHGAAPVPVVDASSAARPRARRGRDASCGC